MVFNEKMEEILKQIDMGSIQPNNQYPIWVKKNVVGEPYYGVGHFWNMDKTPVEAGRDLVELEWNGNDILLDRGDPVPELVARGLAVLMGWKKQMETDYAGIPFDILLSVDWGCEEDGILPSVSMRFWAVRNGVHYIEPESVMKDDFWNAILMEQVNV